MAVLVTGGAGYIGSVATERLLAAGEDVVVVDNFVTGHRLALAPEARLVEGNIRDEVVLAKVFAEHTIDTVMHFAAYSLVGESVQEPAKYFENNVEGAHSVLKAMHVAGVRRFILSSTAAVYGDPDRTPITEDMPTRPLNPYGLSKRVIEQMLEWYDRAYGLRSVCLRYFNACGASATYGEDHTPETHLIPNILMAAEGVREHVKVFGSDYNTPDGTCVRDYIHVEDLADAHIRAMNYLRNDGASEIMNLGNSLGNSVMEVIESVKRVTGKDVPVVMAERRPGDADRLVASSEKAQDLLQWRPTKGDIDTIVRDAWAWRQAHPEGYGDATIVEFPVDQTRPGRAR
jgi:UDP-glucose 4-epimerase